MIYIKKNNLDNINFYKSIKKDINEMKYKINMNII